MKITQTEIAAYDRIYRLNLINSLSGYKSANLIGSKGTHGENLAIFNSVIHLGANPPLLGMIMRPHTVPRHTLENIEETGVYTINHVTEKLAERAHYTSANFDSKISEFNACKIEAEYHAGFDAPFVRESPVQIGMKWLESLPIKQNNTFLIIGEISEVHLKDELLTDSGQLDLNKGSIVSISGLNRYHRNKEIGNFPYARPDELPHFEQ